MASQRPEAAGRQRRGLRWTSFLTARCSFLAIRSSRVRRRHVGGVGGCRLAGEPRRGAAERADARNPDTPRKFDSAPEARAQRLRPVRNWGYWLSSFAINDVVAAPHDLLVVDNGVSANRRFMRQRTRDEVARMKQRPDGSRRLLLAYLSIGEAERYRAYWRPEWYDRNKKPTWLGPANPEWDGNYFVQYWAPEWQALMFGKPESYLDIIMAQGFDGVYLDRADAFSYWEKTRPSAQKDMALFLRRLSDLCAAAQPGISDRHAERRGIARRSEGAGQH